MDEGRETEGKIVGKLSRERVKGMQFMLYRYVVGVRYVICNIIIDVSYKLFTGGELEGREKWMYETREAGLSARESWNV